MLFRKKDKPKKPLFRRIINALIYSAVALVIVLLILFGITQTSTFRNWLRETVIDEVNNATNGELFIEDIQGTIFTSLILTNTNYIFENDTLMSAQKIELRTSPLKMVFKIVYIRKLEIENATINLFKDENGQLNISKLIPPSEEIEEDTTSSDFSLKFEIADLKLNNIDFNLQSFQNKYSTAYYLHPDYDDFRLNDVSLSLYAFADISGNEFKLDVDHLEAKPNLTNFVLENFEGRFLLHEEEAQVSAFNIRTSISEIDINAALSGYSLLGDNGVKKIDDAQLILELDAENFTFDDLTTFITATDLLKGTLSVQVNANGSLNNLNIEKLIVEAENTELNGSGELQRITSGENMNINFQLLNSFVDQNFANNLLHTIDIPVYDELGILRFDTLYFKGKPLDFDSGINLRTDKGGINIKSKLNVKNDLIYDINFTTIDLDLNSVAGIQSRLNSRGNIKGEGTTPETIKSEIVIDASRSQIFENNLQKLNLLASVNTGKLKSQLNFISDSLTGNITANMQMNNFENPIYSFKGKINGFDISRYETEPSISSNLNLEIKGEGENLDLENLNLFLSLAINNSTIKNVRIDSTRTIIDVRSDTTERVINIISDLADVTILGKFKVEDVIDILSIKTSLLAKSIEEKIASVQPQFIAGNEFIDLSKSDDLIISNIDKIQNDFSINYTVEFKNFALLSLLLGNSDIEIDGDLSGSIVSVSDSITTQVNADIDYFKFWDGNELIYVSQLIFNAKVKDNISNSDIDKLYATVNLDARRFFMGSDFDDFNLYLALNSSTAELDFSTKINSNTQTSVSGKINFENEKVNLLLDRLLLVQNNYELINDGIIDISYSNDEVFFNKFKLVHNPGEMEILGKFSISGEENLNIKLTDFNVLGIGRDLLGMPANKSLEAVLNLNLVYTGTAKNPLVDFSIGIDSVKFNRISLGSFIGDVNYEQETLQINLDFIKNINQQEITKLKIDGELPLNLALDAEEFLIKERELRIDFVANDFNLQVFNAAIPVLNNLKGILNANVNFTGTFDDVKSTGNLDIENGSFVFEPNNLVYDFAVNLQFDDNKASLEKFRVSNSAKTKGGGTMLGSGEIVHQNFIPEEIELYLNGELKLIGAETRAVSPTLYGDLVIKTKEDISYIFNRGENKLVANVSINKGANLTYSPTQTAFTNESDKFVYVFMEADTNVLQEKRIDSLIVVSESKSEESTASSKLPFDIDLKIKVEDEIKTIFVLSREFNQNLTAYLGGTFEYIVINEESIAQGELILLEGSKLDFIKTFQAEGSIRFYNEIDNPYLNVTASYQNYYNADTLRTNASEYEVLVQIKLEGPLKNLNTNFVQNEENISIYKRVSGRGQFELEPTKGASDAMMFIIVGKFTEDATTQETNLAVSTAASLAGSIVGGYLNEKLGDYVRSVQVSQVGTQTKFSLIGRAGDFRYEIGGTSQMFQDLSRANIKIEVPPFKKEIPALILRLERREPIFESNTSSQMINELGLKYSFEF